jgi:hypothetical protein
MAKPLKPSEEAWRGIERLRKYAKEREEEGKKDTAKDVRNQADKLEREWWQKFPAASNRRLAAQNEREATEIISEYQRRKAALFAEEDPNAGATWIDIDSELEKEAIVQEESLRGLLELAKGREEAAKRLREEADRLDSNNEE